MRKARAALAMVAVTWMAAAWMIAGTEKDAGETARVMVCTVERGDVRRILPLTGVVRWEGEYAAVSPLTGMVETVYVRPGERVRAGQALFRLKGDAQVQAVSAAIASQAALPEELSAAWQQPQLQQMQAELAALTVRAAGDGVVQQVSIVRNTVLAAGSPGMMIGSGGQVIRCRAVQRDACDLAPGMTADVLRHGQRLGSAWVQSVGPAEADAATGQILYPVTLSVEGDIDLPLGASVEAEILLESAVNVPVLPVETLTGNDTVWWVAQGRCYEIQAGSILADDLRCWVSLPEGTEVICSGAGLVHGGRVEVDAP